MHDCLFPQDANEIESYTELQVTHILNSGEEYNCLPFSLEVVTNFGKAAALVKGSPSLSRANTEIL